MKRLLFTFFTAIIATASWAYDAYVDGIFYIFNGDEAIVTHRYDEYPEDNDGAYKGNVVIPSKVTYSGKTYTVTEIGYDAFYHCSDLTSVSIPNSVTSIKSQAFQECKNLVSVTIPNSVTEIGQEAFDNCSSLNSVDLPNSITDIGIYSFRFCTSLESVIVSATNIGAGAFLGCSKLTSATIRESVTSIGSQAFYNCSSLADVYVYATTPMSINSNTFTNYGTLHVKTGCATAYNNADFWKNFNIVEDFLQITAYSSDDTRGSVTGTGEYGSGDVVTLTAKSNSGYVFVRWSDGSTANPYVFSATENKELTAEFVVGDSDLNGRWTLENGVFTYIGNTVMRTYTKASDIPWNSYRSEIKEVIISEGVESVANYAFYNCPNLISVTIPNSVTSIGYDAFEKCTALTSINIPDAVTGIGMSAFSGCI